MAKKPPAPMPDLQPAIDRLRALAAHSADRPLLADGPPRPDAELLELCAKVFDLRAQHDAILREARKLPRAYMDNPAFRAEMKRRDACVTAWRTPLVRIGKIPSKTGAGVYAKAMLIGIYYSTAPMLAVSLVKDLIGNPALRAALWPAEPAGRA
jgi:hypothetical protein